MDSKESVNQFFTDLLKRANPNEWVLLKGYSTPKNIIIFVFVFHLRPCGSKPVKASLVLRTQFKIFWMKTGRVMTVALTDK